MIFYNILGLILCFIWNASVLIGTIYLIDQYDWSNWTLVGTLFFILRWKEACPKEPEQPEQPEQTRIILNDCDGSHHDN
jgi:hypothetical protein